MSFIVAIAVLISAWQIIKNCMDVLVDSNAVNREEVKELLLPYLVYMIFIRSEAEVNRLMFS